MCVTSAPRNLGDTHLSPAALYFHFFCPTPPWAVMDLVKFGDMGSGCEDENLGLASGPPKDCINQQSQLEEPMFGLIELGM